MSSGSRQHVASSFTTIKGAMIEETYATLASWDFTRTKRENLDRLRDTNFIGAGSATWLRDVAKVINRRLDPAKRDRALAELALGGCSLEEWKPLFLWSMTRDEFLVRDFLQNWLFNSYESGTYRVRTEQVEEYLKTIAKRGASVEHDWSDETTKRVAAGLLKIATDFGLLKGTVVKEFATYHLPERSFIYLLHALRDESLNPAKVLSAPDWRIFLLRPGDVERELLRLHQFKQLEYHVAGSLVQLELPCASARDYAQRMIA